MTRLFFTCSVAMLIGSGLVVAETVDEVIRKADKQETIGTTPDQAGAADSLAFQNLPSRTYFMTKHTFRIATEAWNTQRITEARDGGQPPLIVSDIFRDMLKNEYLHNLNKAWPSIKAVKYGEGAARKKKLITDGDPDAVEKTDDPAPNEAPNMRLSKHIRDYYDEWLLQKKDEAPSIYQRFVTPLLSGGGTALLGSSRDYATLDAKIQTLDGKLAPSSKLSVRIAKKNLWGGQTARDIFTNPVRLAIPCDTYEVEATAENCNISKETIAFTKGAIVSRTFQVKSIGPSTSNLPVKSDAVRWTNRSEAEALRQWYRTHLGPSSVIEFDPTPMLQRLSSLPADHGNIMQTYGYEGRWGSPWRKAGRTLSRVDGTGGEPNPAINDSCLNVTFDTKAIDKSGSSGKPDQLRRELNQAVVQWANAFTGESEAKNQPLSSFSINGEFFAKMALRAQAEQTATHGGPVAVTARAEIGDAVIRCSDFVRWDRHSFNKYVTSSSKVNSQREIRGRDVTDATETAKPIGPADDQIDLIVRFVPTLTVSSSASDAVAVFVNTKGHQGVIEILAKPNWMFLAENDRAPANGSKGFQFRNVILHELGHYFGLMHLPDPRPGHDFLRPCVMSHSYSQTVGTITPADAAMVNAIEYISLDVKGRICEGLKSD